MPPSVLQDVRCKGANCIQPGSSASRSAAFGGVGRLGTTAKARGRGWKPTTPRTQRLASLRQELDLHVPGAGLHVRGARGGAPRSSAFGGVGSHDEASKSPEGGRGPGTPWPHRLTHLSQVAGGL